MLNAIIISAVGMLIREFGKNAPKFIEYVLEEIGDDNAIANVRRNADIALAAERAKDKLEAEAEE